MGRRTSELQRLLARLLCRRLTESPPKKLGAGTWRSLSCNRGFCRLRKRCRLRSYTVKCFQNSRPSCSVWGGPGTGTCWDGHAQIADGTGANCAMEDGPRRYGLGATPRCWPTFHVSQIYEGDPLSGWVSRASAHDARRSCCVSFEGIVMDGSSSTWCSFSRTGARCVFSDHQGSCPRPLSVTGSVSYGHAHEVMGSIGSRPLAADSSFFLAHPTWLVPLAVSSRLSIGTTSFRLFPGRPRNTALQNMGVGADERLLTCRAASFWTLRWVCFPAGRCKPNWSSEDSDQFARMQRAVSLGGSPGRSRNDVALDLRKHR